MGAGDAEDAHGISAQPSAGVDPLTACAACLARSWLLARLAGHLDNVGPRIAEVLELGDQELIAAVGGADAAAIAAQFAAFDPEPARRREQAAGIEPLCQCSDRYPERLRSLRSRPSVLHVGGGLQRFLEIADAPSVAIVGARRASPYGLEIARSLAQGLARAAVPVISGMALGIDSAAHSGALAAAGATVAVLPAGVEHPYPRSKRGLWQEIGVSGSIVSELPSLRHPRRWMFPARNRIIAALATMTIVVEAGERAGALITARFASQLGRAVGAVPGQVLSPVAAGANELIANGAQLITGPQDVLDGLFGVGVRSVPAPAGREELGAQPRALLDGIARGYDLPAALELAGLSPAQGLAVLASLELGGFVRREPGGRFLATA